MKIISDFQCPTRPKGALSHSIKPQIFRKPHSLSAGKQTYSKLVHVHTCMLGGVTKTTIAPPKKAQDGGKEGEMGTGVLGFASVTPPCSSDIFKPAHLSLPSEICFYNFAKTFIYGSGQLAAWRAMCQWSWRMPNVWDGSAQTASTWFANILVLCI